MSRDLAQHPRSRKTAEDVILDTPRGPVVIRSKCPPGSFSGLTLDAGLGRFSHYSSIIQKLEVFDRVASEQDGRVALALLNEAIVVGYLTCRYPDETERWSKLADLMYEMAAIEVSRHFRGFRVAPRMLARTMADDSFEDKISYMVGYSWHWDLDGSGLTMAQYRRKMITLLKPFGFQEQYTNEPNVTIREENVFMARIGSRVSEEDRKRFRNLRFGIMDKR